MGAIGLIAYGSTRPLKRTFYGKVIDLVPKQEELPPGWTVEYKPIADTPEMKKAVDELLNYDDAVYAVYSKGTQRISVYIAYWTPGKMSQRLVAGHTPDVCWVGAGWRVVTASRAQLTGKGYWLMDSYSNQLREGVSVPTEERFPDEESRLMEVLCRRALAAATALNNQEPRTNNPAALPPAEARTMDLNGQTEHVLFWHIVGGEPVSYKTQKQPPWYAFLADAIRRGLNQRQEQFFVRIASNEFYHPPST